MVEAWGRRRITHADILAYSVLMRQRFEPWEVDEIVHLDGFYHEVTSSKAEGE